MGKADLDFLVAIKILTKGQAKEFASFVKQIRGASDVVDNLTKVNEQLDKQLRQIKIRTKEVTAELKAQSAATQKFEKEATDVKNQRLKVMSALAGKQSAINKTVIKATELLNKETSSRKEQIKNQREGTNLLGVALQKQNELNNQLKRTEKQRMDLANKEKSLNTRRKESIKTTNDLKNKQGELRQRTQTLSKTIADNKAKIKENAIAQKDLSKKVGVNSVAFKKTKAIFERYGITVKKGVKDLTALNASLTDQQRLMIRSKMATEKAAKGIKQFGSIGEKTFQTTLRTIKRIITTMITLSALFFFRNLIKQGAEFENMMIRVGAIAKATGESFTRLVGSMRKIARETIFTASEVGQTAQVLAQAGFNVREILGSLLPILKLTTATMGELKQTAELTVAILRTFDIGVKNTIDVVNVLTEATISSRADIERLATAFRFAGPAGAAFNQSLETTIASLSKFIDMGLSASIAGTTFRRALIQLSQGTARQIKILKQLNVRFEQINPSLNDFGIILQTLAKTTLNTGQAIKLFGARAGAAIFSLIQRIREGGESVIDFTKQLADAKELNRVDEVYSKVLESIRSQFLITKSVMEDMAMSLFQVFRPALSEIILITRDAFAELNEQLQSATGQGFKELITSMIPLLGALIIGIKDVVVIFASLFSMVVSLVAAFKPFEFALKAAIQLLAIIAIRNVFYNKTTIAMAKNVYLAGIAIWEFSKKTWISTRGLKSFSASIQLAKIGVVSFWKNLKIATFALNVFKFAIGAFIIPAAMILLSYILEKIIGLFMKSKESADEFGESTREIGDHVNFATEQLQKYSDQVGIQIKNEEHLNNLLRQKRVLMGQVVGAQAELLQIELPDISKAMLRAKDLTPIERADQLLNAMGESAQNISVILAQFPKIIKKMIPVGEATLIPFSVTQFKEYNENVEKAAKQLEKSLSEGGIIAATRFINNFVKGIIGNEFKDILSKISEFTSKQIGQAIEGDKNLEKALESIGAKIGVKSAIAVGEMLVDAEKVAKNMSGIMQTFAAQNEAAFINTLAQIGKTREAIDKMSDSFKTIGKDSNLIIETQEKLNIHAKVFIKNNEEIKKRRKEINDMTNYAISLFKKANKEERDGQVEQAKFRKATALSVLMNVKNSEKLLKRIQDVNNELGSVMAKWEKIAAETELSRIQEKIALEQIKLEDHLRDRMAKNIENQNKNFEQSIILSNNFIKNVKESASGFRDIGIELESMNRKISFSKSLTEMENLTGLLFEQEIHEAKILKLNTELERKKAEINARFTARIGATKNLNNKLEEEFLTTTRNKELAEASLDVRMALTKEQELGNKILKTRINIYEKIKKSQLETVDIIKEIAQERHKENLPEYAKEMDNINKKYLKRKIEMEEGIEFLEKAEKINRGNFKIHANINTELNKKIAALDETEDRYEEEKKLVLEIIKLKNQDLAIEVLIAKGMSNTAQAIKQKIDANRKYMGAMKELVKMEGMEDKTDLDKERIKLQKEYVNQLRIMDDGKFWEKAGLGMNAFVDSFKPAVSGTQQLIDSSRALGNEVKRIFTDLAKEALLEKLFDWYGVEKETDDALKKITKDYAKAIADIMRQYYDAIAEATKEHRTNLNDINNRFDDITREREIDIYNERVERLMSLAALEQELRSQGLTSEEQRMQLLTEIDQALATSRIGTIEERQIKLAEIESQVKALNALENQLGMSRAEIEASSIARLSDLRKATSNFYTDKRTEALTSIAAERNAEINAEAARHDENIKRIEREKTRALEEARINHQSAIDEIKTEDDKKDKMKRMQAELTAFVILEMAKVAAASIVENAKLIVSDTAAGIWKVFKQLGVYAVVAIPIVLASIAAMSAMYKKGGIVKEQKKDIGGLINGGHGGIDDIHTRIPVNSFIVNKQSTGIHHAELDMMAARNVSRNYSKQANVALTAGEYFIPPPASIRYRNRLERINRDKTGSILTGQYSGGSIKGFQYGGTIPNNSGESKTINIEVVNDFSGVNILSGESETAVAEFYQEHIQKHIQEDIDNNALVGT